MRLTDIEAIWLVKDSALEGVDFDAEKVVAVWEPAAGQGFGLARKSVQGYDRVPILDVRILHKCAFHNF